MFEKPFKQTLQLLLSPGTKLQWSTAITLAVLVWIFTAFWAAMPLIGWGEYDYEPLRTCCTLDISKGDRYCSYPSDATKTNSGHFTSFKFIFWDKIPQPCLCSSFNRNYVSYVIPMSIFNMGIQVFVVMSSYQSIAQKFQKTGNPRVSNTTRQSSKCHTIARFLLRLWDFNQHF